jgi:hypothetical protein
MSTESELAAKIAERLALITIANDYSTDIGTLVLEGRTKIDPENELPCSVLVEMETRVEDSQSLSRSAKAKTVQRYLLIGHDVCDPDAPNQQAYRIIADLKRAIFSGDRTFGSIVRPEDLIYSGREIAVREDGTAVISASITIDCKFVENLTDP